MSNRLRKGDKRIARHSQEKGDFFPTADKFLDFHFGKRKEIHIDENDSSEKEESDMMTDDNEEETTNKKYGIYGLRTSSR
jgi:hypothetical protein